jgi:hypothetical protein
VAKEGRKVERVLLGIAGEVVGFLQARAWQALVSATPVYTGFARSSWFPTLGSPLTQPIEKPSLDAAARQAAAKQLAENRGRSKKIQDTYRIGQGAAFITNPASYIVFLNGGSSAQAPAMFVERAVEQAAVSLRNFRPRRSG